MCTIGVLYSNSGFWAFKNRDLVSDDEIYEPMMVDGGAVFPADKSGDTVWAGVNRSSVFVLGADGNSIVDHVGPKFCDGSETWKTYKKILNETKNATDALFKLIERYNRLKVGDTGDIVILGDKNGAFIIEYSYKHWAVQRIDPEEDGFGIRTNFFVNLSKLRPSQESSALHMSSSQRYSRALNLAASLDGTEGITGIEAICADRHGGESSFSIARKGGKGDYKTRASAIFEYNFNTGLSVSYTLNSLPEIGGYRKVLL